jgi:YD repeat-containing protein
VQEQSWEHTEGSTTQKRRLVYGWRADDKVSERRWYGDDTLLQRTETMDYDDRGRLILHAIDAVAGEHPLDETGQPYVKQEFEHDCLDNLRTVTTTLLDGRVNVTRYGYDPVDFDRLVSVSNSLEGYPGHGTPLELIYDANGNLIDDGQGRTLHWDGAGRLANVTLADDRRITYVHGPDGRVCSTTIGGVPRYRYRDDGAIAFEVDELEGRRFIRAEGGIVAETRLAGAIRETFLLGTDPQGSVVTESVPDGTP